MHNMYTTMILIIINFEGNKSCSSGVELRFEPIDLERHHSKKLCSVMTVDIAH